MALGTPRYEDHYPYKENVGLGSLQNIAAPPPSMSPLNERFSSLSQIASRLKTTTNTLENRFERVLANSPAPCNQPGPEQGQPFANMHVCDILDFLIRDLETVHSRLRELSDRCQL
ncbi:MAG: hypothetical protein E6R03_03095 [Hyphomicrobiaceae bacterium]|nr:MAG: hypothetical protein E6R03_03095 [Hyphomicrobiaceae bacterium]